jgi:hypothetical protein
MGQNLPSCSLSVSNGLSGSADFLGTSGTLAASGKGILNISNAYNPNDGRDLVFGITSKTGYYGAWMQSIDAGNLANTRPLAINPNGGTVVIGKQTYTTGVGLDVKGAVDIQGYTSVSRTTTNADVPFFEVWANDADSAPNNYGNGFGIGITPSDGGAWLQAGLNGWYQSYGYPLKINPHGGNVFLCYSSNVAVGNAVGTARLHLPASATGAGTASLKIDSGAVATTPVSGNIESDGTHIYWTDSSNVRHQLDN